MSELVLDDAANSCALDEQGEAFAGAGDNGVVDMPRSSRASVRNPLLELEAARHLQALPAHLGWQLRQALMALRAAAHERAESCWLRRRSRLAMYWRCCAVYAGHCARLITTDESGARGRNEPDAPNVAVAMTRPPPHAFGRPPLLGLPEALSLLGLCEEASGPLRTLLIELRAAAHAKAQHSWVKRKGPLAAYWRDVSTHAGLVERLLR